MCTVFLSSETRKDLPPIDVNLLQIILTDKRVIQDVSQKFGHYKDGGKLMLKQFHQQTTPHLL